MSQPEHHDDVLSVATADTVASRSDFVCFVSRLRESLASEPSRWENVTLDDFLEALGGFADDLEGFWHWHGPPPETDPDWALFAHLLHAGATYE